MLHCSRKGKRDPGSFGEEGKVSGVVSSAKSSNAKLRNHQKLGTVGMDGYKRS